MSAIIPDILDTVLVTLAAPTAAKLLRGLLVAGVKLIATSTGQTLVRDYIEHHYYGHKSHHRPDTGTPAEPKR